MFLGTKNRDENPNCLFQFGFFISSVSRASAEDEMRPGWRAVKLPGVIRQTATGGVNARSRVSSAGNVCAATTRIPRDD